MALVLIVTYVAGLFFSLKTHRDLFNPEYDDGDTGEPWTVRTSVIALAIAGVAVGVMSEILVGSITEPPRKRSGSREFFIGVIVVAIVGNAAEHWVAVLVAMQGQDGPGGQHRDRLQRPDRPVRRAGARPRLASSSARTRWRWSSTASSSAAILLAVLIANHVTQEGESTWFEGVQLLAVYFVFGIAFFVA